MIKILRPEDELDRLTKQLEFERFCRDTNTLNRRDPVKPLLVLAVGVFAIISFIGLGIAMEWQPGEQEAIASAYKARQHGAVLLVEHKPSVEIRP